MNNLADTLLAFLQKGFSPHEKLLLGLSGGCDSLALFHLLLDCRKQFPLTLGIAHIDHGWREESAEEAKILEKLAEAHKLPFHLTRLSPEENNRNLEAKCRERRIAFFQKTCGLHGYRGVLLAHHRDDQVETVLKNILEGTNLFSQKGIREHTVIDGLSIWRPLLNISKATLAQYLETKGATPFIDRTNLDPHFLRGRMRTEILPYLTSLFGKQIDRNLIEHQKEQEDLMRFMQERHGEILNSMIAGPFGCCLDLSSIQHTLDLRFLIRIFCQRAGATPSKQSVENLIEAWQKGASNKQFPVGEQTLHLDRQRLFLVPSKTDYLWELELATDLERNSCWRAFAEGTFRAILPEENGPYRLGPAKMNAPYANRSEIGAWWSSHKIPAFLRRTIPVVWKEDRIVHEFLTGKANPLHAETPCAKKISLILRVRETHASPTHNG